jgi:Xaa-Pro dipeptidase
MDTERIDRVRRTLELERLDALVCRLPENVLFLTGYWPLSGISFLLFPREGEPACIVPHCEEEEARQALAGAVCQSYRYGDLGSGDMYEQVTKSLGDLSRGRRWKRIGFEGRFESVAPAWNVSEPSVPAAVSAAMYERVWGKRRLRDATAVLNLLRARKTPREAEGIRRANEIACFGLRTFQEILAEGMTGVDLVAEVERAVMTRGTGFKGAGRVRAFAQVAAGRQETAAGWRPMELFSRRPIAGGDLALLELGVVADGYWSDRTRVRVAGDPLPRHREVFGAVLAAQEAAIRMVRKGVVAADVDAAARHVMESAGLGREFLHITGHGLGFRYHEPVPFIAPGSATVLEEGMVFSVEPGAYSELLGGIRLEDNVLVTDSGAEVLGPFEKKLAG